MKKHHLLLLSLLFFVPVFSSCDEEPADVTMTYGLKADPQSLTFVAQAAPAQTVTVTAENIEWTAALDDGTVEWLHLEDLEGAVSVTVDDNPDPTERSAKFTIVSSDPSKASSLEIAVTQRGIDFTPSLEADPLELEFEYVNDTRPVAITANVAWEAAVTVGGEWVNIEETADGIAVSAAYNMTPDSREGAITISGEGVDPVTITVLQEAGEDIPNNLNVLVGGYGYDLMSMDGGRISPIYMINMYDVIGEDGLIVPETGIYVYLNVFADNTEDLDASEVDLPVGTYTFAPFFTEDAITEFTAFSDMSSIVFYEDGETTDYLMPAEGSFTVEKDGDKTIVKFKDVVMSDGSIFSESFYGETKIINGLRWSTLTDDIDMGTLTGESHTISSMGDPGKRLYEWQVVLPGDGVVFTNRGYSGTGHAVSLDIIGQWTSPLSIPSGTYVIDKSMEAFTVYPGGIMDGTMYSTYVQVDSGERTGGAPLKSGEVTISSNDGIYTLEIDAMDELGNKITGTYIGAIQL